MKKIHKIKPGQVWMKKREWAEGNTLVSDPRYILILGFVEKESFWGTCIIYYDLKRNKTKELPVNKYKNQIPGYCCLVEV